MCGLVGIAGDLEFKHKEAFKNLLIVDAVRGTHGTGVASVGITGDVDWFKRYGNPHDLIDHKHYDKTVTVNKKILLGHNRHATTGSHTSDNAHPFDFKYVIGAHNGTLPNDVRRELTDYHKYDTDSEALYASINSNIAAGISFEESVKTVVGNMHDGAWALSMYAKKSKQLAFLRNKERPLFYCFADEGKILAWASESWMLWSQLMRAGIKIDDKVTQMSEDVLYVFNIPSTGSAFEVPKRYQAPGAPKKVWGSQADFYRGATTTGGYTHTHKGTSTPVFGLPAPKKTTFPNDNKRGHYKPPYKSPYGDVIKKPEFEKLIKDGHTCCYCNSHTPVYGEEVLFLKPSPVGSVQYACKICVNDNEIMEILRALR